MICTLNFTQKRSNRHEYVMQALEIIVHPEFGLNRKSLHHHIFDISSGITTLINVSNAICHIRNAICHVVTNEIYRLILCRLTNIYKILFTLMQKKPPQLYYIIFFILRRSYIISKVILCLRCKKILIFFASFFTE